MVSMIPFDLSRLDNTRDADNSKLPVMDRILGLCKVGRNVTAMFSMTQYDSVCLCFPCLALSGSG